jgi:hypothetical protein
MPRLKPQLSLALAKWTGYIRHTMRVQVTLHTVFGIEVGVNYTQKD